MDYLNTEYLSTLPVDLIFQLLTYLSFQDVINVSELNSKFYSYCINPQYNNKWKRIIDNTFSSVVYNYEDKLKKIWSKLNLNQGSYNYVIYTKLIDLLDPLTQLMIYYLDNNTKSFNSNKFTVDQRFLTMFLLNKPEEMKKYKPYFDNKPYYLLLDGKTPAINVLNDMLTIMAGNGNVRGVKYMIDKGVNIHLDNYFLETTSLNGHLDVVKYLVEQGANIHAHNDTALIGASMNGHLDVVKYLVEQGSNIHTENNHALYWASYNRHRDVVKYLVEQHMVEK